MSEEHKPGGGEAAPPPPGLDREKHAKAQRAAAKGEVIRKGFTAAHMATALPMGEHLTPADYEAYLDGLKADLKASPDALQDVLIEQIAFAHLRLASLHAGAELAQSIEGRKILNAACSRLMGEVRRTALALEAVRGKGSTPAKPHLKIAQTG